MDIPMHITRLSHDPDGSITITFRHDANFPTYAECVVVVECFPAEWDFRDAFRMTITNLESE